MRTLNRPMFRYGGPIKEGVMHGIREPKRHGGSMGEPQGKNLVGDSIYPKTDGRAHHAIFGGLGVIAGLTAAARAAMRFGPSVYKGIKAGKYVPGWLKPTGNFRTVAGKDPSPAFIKGDPSAFSGSLPSKMGMWKALGDPKRLGMAIKENPGTALTLGSLTGSGASMLWPDGTPKTEEEIIATSKQKRGVSGAPGGGDPNMTYTAPPPPPTAAEIEAAEAENRIKQMKKYKEIMDIKGMKKDAVYKSLVDVSKQIQEGGSLKEQLKSGSLISNLTQAASKRFDKVADTETALRSLVAKGEIDKEMNKEDKALTRQLKKTQLKLAEKGLAGDSFEEAILKSITGQQGKMPTGGKLAGILKATRGIDSVVLDGSGMSKPGDEIKFLETQISKGIKKGNVINPGAYVINSKILIIDENNNVTQYY